MVWGRKKNPGYSYFSVGATLEGRLCFTGITRLDGRVNGEIVSPGTLVVEETAVINGQVLVESIILSGTVHGDITAFKHVQLNASARVYGHISYGELSIEGALHEGGSHKLTAEEIEAAQLRCHDQMEEAAANAERPRPAPAPPEAPPARRTDGKPGGKPEGRSHGPHSEKKPGGGPPKKSAPASAKPGSGSSPKNADSAPPAKSGAAASPPSSAKSDSAKPEPEPSEAKSSEGWATIKIGGSGPAKDSEGPSAKPNAASDKS